MDSRQSQAFASFTEDSADRLRTLLTVKEVAAYLHVSTETVYRLCALGELRHIRVLNAIRIAPSDVDALVFARERIEAYRQSGIDLPILSPFARGPGAKARFEAVIRACAPRMHSYCAIKPPSMTSSVPVMKEASSEARKRTP